MFSSNQVLKISGKLNNVEKVLKFALEYSGNIKDLEKSEKERGCLLVYQITNKGYYCIGWGFKDVPKGWSVYPFDFEIDIVSKLIIQQLNKLDYNDGKYDCYDGSIEHGFLMSSIEGMHYEYLEEKGIINPSYGIVIFEPFINYYAK